MVNLATFIVFGLDIIVSDHHFKFCRQISFFFKKDEYKNLGEYILKPICISNAVRGKHFTSSQNILFVSFRSNNTVGRSSRLFCLEKKCGFRLSVRPSRIGTSLNLFVPKIFVSRKYKISFIECGGDVNDDSGYITTPGYPNQLQTNIICDWTFRAGIGFRYVFDFTFVNQEVNSLRIRE